MTKSLQNLKWRKFRKLGGVFTYMPFQNVSSLCVSVFFWGGWPYLITELICKYQLITCFGWISRWIGSPRAWFLTEKMGKKSMKAENVHDFNQRFQIPYYLVVEPTRLKNNKNMLVKMDHETPRIGLNIKNIWVVTSQHWFPSDFHLWFQGTEKNSCLDSFPLPSISQARNVAWTRIVGIQNPSFWYPKFAGNESTYPTYPTGSLEVIID